MKKLTTATLLVAILAVSASCKKDVIGEGPVSTQVRIVSNFSGIDLQMNGNVYYTNATDWKVEVTAKQTIHEQLETKLVNGKLVVRYRNGKTYDADESIRINVSGPSLANFELNSSGSIYCQNMVQAANIYLRSKGSGHILLNGVTTDHIDAECTVSGSIKAAGGNATSERLKTSASGDIDFSSVVSKNVTARITGSGKIRVQVTDKLEATLDGSGSVYFLGSPTITTHINGTGRLVRL